MSWIQKTLCFALTSLVWLASASAQTPQLAPPQFGPNDGARGFNDVGPQPNLAAPPNLGQPASAAPVNDESREYLRLLNQPTTAPTTSAPPGPAAMNLNQANPSQANPAAPASFNNGSVNVATRPEPTPAAPTVQAGYQLPTTPISAAATAPANGQLPTATPNVAPANVPATYTAPLKTEPSQNVPLKNETPKNEPLKLDAANNSPRPLSPSGAKPLPLAGPNTKSAATNSSWSSFGTMLGSLAIVLGLFVVTIKLLRRGMPGAKQKLGREVVEILGQTPLAPRQSLQVIRFGNKILLVAMSPDGCDTLTEITDPLEVDRLAGMCQQAEANSSTKTFGDMLRQVTSLRPTLNEPAATPPSDSILDEVRARLRTGSPTNREVTHG